MAGFFLELQRSIQTSRNLSSKLTRYSDLFLSGANRQTFGIRGMRVLVVFTIEPAVPTELRVTRAVEQAERLGITLAFFATLDSVRSAKPQDLFLAPLWRQPGQVRPIPLFEVGGDTAP